MPTKPSTKAKAKASVWTPDLFDKQWDVFNSYGRYLLVSGSRLSGKTLAVLHRIARHLWETPRAKVGFFAKSIKSAKDSGSWQDFMDIIVPIWVNAGIGFEITTFDKDGTPGPKQDGQTRTAFIKFRNMHGGQSEMRLFSIEHDHQVEDKVKNKSFTLMFFAELSLFKDPRVFHHSIHSLRGVGYREDQFQWIGDTNPDVNLGNQSWFYKLWYEERAAKDHPDPEFQKDLHLIELFLDDNPHITPKQIAALRATKCSDPAMYESNFLGIHGDGGRQIHRLFATLFDRSLHVIGGKEGEGDQIDIRETCTELYTGWDLGASNNHGAGILEKWFKMINGVPKMCWSILDELVSLHEKVSLHEFALEFMEKYKELEARYPGKVFDWYHWSDDSATNVYRASSGSYDYAEILAATKGKIKLRGVAKPKNSIMARIRLLRMLLQQKRIFVSSRCKHVISMLEWAKKGKDDDEPILNDEHKHTFDWVTYPMYMEAIDDLVEEANEDPKATETEYACLS